MTKLIIVTAVVACSQTHSVPHNTSPADDAPTLGARADQMLVDSVRLDYSRPFDDRPLTRSNVRAAYRQACHAGDHHACWVASEVDDQVGDHHDRTDAEVAANCLAGDVLSCQADPAETPNWLGSCSRDCTLAELRRDCARGFAYSCANLAAATQMNDEIARRTVSLFRQGCDARVLRHCQWLAESHFPGVPEADRQRAYNRICELTLESCTPLPHHGRDQDERVCQFGRGNRIARCYFSVVGYYERRYPEPVAGRGKRLARWICAESKDEWFCRW